MAITRGYAEVADLDTHLGDNKGRDVAMKERAIEAASRVIDSFTGRRFDVDTEPSSRLFNAVGGSRLYVDDFTSVVSVTPEDSFGQLGAEVASSAYRAGPFNAPVNGEPYNWIEGFFSWWGTAISVEAVWGWPAIPAAVTQACLLKAARIYKRRESVNGIVGLDEFGPVRVGRDDADVIDLLSPYKLLVVA